ncbi:MAG: NADP-dependent oxidoreductase [Anaerolineae bacterium]
MQAIAFTKFGGPEVMQLMEVPRPELRPNDVLIRVAAAGVNPADSAIRKGQFKLFTPIKGQFVPGADVAGVIEAVGSAVTEFRIGERVYAMLPNLSGGGYAQFAAVKATSVARIPTNLSMIEAAGVPLAALTAYQALQKANITHKMPIIINGASGGVGTFAVQIAKALGAHVTATSSPVNHDLLRRLGVDRVLDYHTHDFAKDQTRYATFVDAAAVLSYAKMQVALQPKGIAVTLNPGIGNPVSVALSRLGRTRLVSLLVRPDGKDLAKISEMIASGTVCPVVDKVYEWTEAAEAHRHIETRHAKGKIILVVDASVGAKV